MIVIEIDSIATKSRSGVSAKGPWTMIFQQVSISGLMKDGFPSKFPRESSIQLDTEKPQPYAVGRYTIAPESFYFGEFDRFALGRLKLQPLKDYFKDCEHQLGLVVQYGQQKAAA